MEIIKGILVGFFLMFLMFAMALFGFWLIDFILGIFYKSKR